MIESYTHATHAKRCQKAAQGRVVLVAYVQVQMHRLSVCGRISGAWTTADGVDLWSVDLLTPIKGRSSFRPDRVRQCSGIDGRCICSGEAQPDRAELAMHGLAAAAATEGKPSFGGVTCK